MNYYIADAGVEPYKVLSGGKPITSQLYPDKEIFISDLKEMILVATIDGSFLLNKVFLTLSNDDDILSIRDGKNIYINYNATEVVLPIYVFNMLKYNVYKWTRYGGYEVSSHGDKRFSAFYAKLSCGKTIEEIYQLDIKGYRSLGYSIKDAKGKSPIRRVSRDDLYLEYKGLWWTYINENMSLFRLLITTLEMDSISTLSDKFATTNVNQARAISELLNDLLILDYGIRCDGLVLI